MTLVYRIGTVARLAQVSVRTLRHYDDVGLLHPTRVDPDTGYRWYAPEQLARLHRILALRDLGVPLGEIAELLGNDVTVEQLRGILLLRRAEAHDRIAAEAERLARVEARLQQLEETEMDDYEVIVKGLDPVRVVTASQDVADPSAIGDALGTLYPRLHAALGRHGVEFREPSYALYEDTDDEELSLRVAAALLVPDGVTIADDGVATVDLPAVARAATTVVRGAPEDKFHDAFRALHDWAERTGEQTTGFEREVYLDCDGPATRGSPSSRRSWRRRPAAPASAGEGRRSSVAARDLSGLPAREKNPVPPEPSRATTSAPKCSSSCSTTYGGLTTSSNSLRLPWMITRRAPSVVPTLVNVRTTPLGTWTKSQGSSVTECSPSSPHVIANRPERQKKASTVLRWAWSAGPFPGEHSAMDTEMASPASPPTSAAYCWMMLRPSMAGAR